MYVVNINKKPNKLTSQTKPTKNANMIIKLNPKIKNVIPKADQNTEGTKNVRCVRFLRYLLKFLSLKDGITPLLYFKVVNTTFGINKEETSNKTISPIAIEV